MGEVPRSQRTLLHSLRGWARARPDDVFLDFEDGPPLTFGALDRRSDAMAAALARQGVGAGERVFALLHNRPALLVAMFAAHKVGAIFVPVNTELRGAFLQHQLRNADPAIVLVEGDLLAAFTDVTAPGHRVATVGVVGEPGARPAVFAGAEYLDLAALDTEPATGLPLHEPGPAEIACIMYTSGTTGPSKGVLMPQAHLWTFAHGSRRALGLTAADRYYICMPLFHANALLMQLGGALLAGASAYVVRRFSPTRWLQDVRRSGATVTNGLGVIPEFIFRTPPTPHDRAHRLRIMMAVPIAAEWSGAFQERFGVPFLQGYGMTECNIPCYTDPGELSEPGCAGAVLPEFELQIVDPETDEPRPAGAVGEIVVRPREPFAFMAGYFQAPDKTVEAWRNLWFHTGDAGWLDGRGRLHFVDRIKDCIRRRGENISSFEVEQCLNAHPAVAESAVVGVKVAGAGGEDEVLAVVTPREGAAVDPAALLDWCVPRMPRFAVPRFVLTADRLDKTATGKILKQGYKEPAVVAGAWDREAAGYVVPR
jgi:crotonobetaine/carnitine-CoA ligase